MALLQLFFILLIVSAAIHTLLCWILLLKIGGNELARNEIFGSVKTLILGPMTMRLKHLFVRTIPHVIDLQSDGIRKAFIWARWSGWFVMLVLAGVIVMQVVVFMSGVGV